MTKKEVVWREILHQTLENKKIEFTQKDLAKKYGFSLSTVFNALKIPRSSGAIKATGRGFKILDIEKLLYLWATFRQLNKEIIYQGNVQGSVREIEGSMPPNAIFGVFSAFVKKYKEAPADYDKVYVYLEKEKLKEIEKRFPTVQLKKRRGNINLIVLKTDPWLKNPAFSLVKKGITPDCQTFVDLWNVQEWYAKDFLNTLKEKILK